ncbi:MAG: hydroxymethylbilane synthase [Salinarimonadaceae bacterium]|nr:MAG: hydroxymethylbilane synthase [Salinarimonadaceae bacterium]
MSERKSLVIGTRGSPLALAQANETAARLAQALGWPNERFPLDVIRTSGDMIQDRALSEAGGKGLFTKEIDAAQIAGRVDVTVHSAKDLPNDLPDGLVIAGYLPREDARDALIARAGASLADLPRGARVGSASLRRQALLRRARPDLEVSLLRGNVGTRLQKIADGAFDATLLAMAGLRRLGLTEHVTAPLDVEAFTPAVGQGAIAIVVRADDAFATEAVARILCRETGLRLAAERAFLAVLDGSCRTPIAGHATLAGERIRLTGLIARPDGSQTIEGEREGMASDAAALGADLGEELRARTPSGFFGD